jgi:hypothetical protein
MPAAAAGSVAWLLTDHPLMCAGKSLGGMERLAGTVMSATVFVSGPDDKHADNMTMTVHLNYAPRGSPVTYTSDVTHVEHED